MHRTASGIIMGICVLLSACGRPSGPPPAPESRCVIPPDCQPYSGKIPVPKDGMLSTAQECLVLDRRTLVEWQGNPDVKSLRIDWQDVSVDDYCDVPPKAPPVCSGPNCQFDPSTLPAMTVDYCLCYKLIPTAFDASTTATDPRLIIKR